MLNGICRRKSFAYVEQAVTRDPFHCPRAGLCRPSNAVLMLYTWLTEGSQEMKKEGHRL